jgi:hypothetical protein
LNQLEATLHERDKDDERIKKIMSKKGDQKGIPLAESPFNYAVSYWLKHATEVPHGIGETSLSRELWELVRDFFWDKDGEIFMGWLTVFVSTGEKWHEETSTRVVYIKPLASDASKSNATSIAVAAAYGLVDIFEWAYLDGVDFDAPNGFNMSPLIEAARVGELGVVKTLLSKHTVRINRTICNMSTPEQCSNGDCGSKGYTALMYAAERQDLGMLRLLLGQPGIEVDLVSQDTRPLEWQLTKRIQKLSNY